MSKIVQIGSGMIGTTMAYDLSQEHDIIVGDFDDSSFAKLERLNPNIVTKTSFLLRKTPFSYKLCMR